MSQTEESIQDLERKVPANIQAEQMLLGSILLNNDTLNRVGEFLKSEHFYQPVHQRIYKSILDIIDKGLSATPVSLKNIFDKDPDLVEVGGSDYLSRLVSLSTGVINAYDYGMIIYNLYLRRKLIGIGEDIVNEAYTRETEVSSESQIEEAETKLFNLANEGDVFGKGFKNLKTSLLEAIDRTQNAYQTSDKVVGISSGFTDIDKKLGGFNDSDLVILAGRPSMGKTALALNIALNSSNYLQEKHKQEASEGGAPPSVGFFSLEMSAEQLASRLISMQAEINASNLRTGSLSADNFSKIVRISKTLHDMPMFIDDTPALSISAIRTRARKLKRKHNLSILFVDYLQLINSSVRASSENRVLEISEITQGLKAIAKELDIPVIALSQLSRAVEQREDKRPLLSDLRESGSIEQDADIVMFIYREEYYESRREPEPDTEKHTRWRDKMDKIRNLADVIVAKHRNGPVGTAQLYFESDFTKFDNLDKVHSEME
jgi:replicative DNA helicase